MRAVYRRELLAGLTNLTGFLVIAILLLAVGVYGSAMHFDGLYSGFEYTVSGVSLLLLVLVPVLTMQSLAQERQQKTMLLLYALPLGTGSVVLGKYFALLTIFAIPVACMCLWPLILSLYGGAGFAAAYVAIAGFFLLGAALLALGLFVSSLTENQLVAAAAGFALLLLSYFMPALPALLSLDSWLVFCILTLPVAALLWFLYRAGGRLWPVLALGCVLEIPLGLVCLLEPRMLEGPLVWLQARLALFAPLDSFLYGVFDWNAVVYYFSVCFLFVFFSIQSLEKRRWN